MPEHAGAGRLLASVYGVFVLAAGARSAVQLATHAGRAPVAYGLSAGAAVGYAIGLTLLVRVERGAGPGAARVWCGIELAAVLAVGTVGRARPDAFGDATVWSDFGRGYGFVPLLLPVVVLVWLRHARTAARTGGGVDAVTAGGAQQAPALDPASGARLETGVAGTHHDHRGARP